MISPRLTSALDGRVSSWLVPVFCLSTLAIPVVANAQAAAGGSNHTVLVTPAGAVFTWGDNSAGQIGDGTSTQRTSPTAITSLTNVTGVAAGTQFSAALKSDGTVWTWGANWYGQLGHGDTTTRYTPTQVSGLTSVTAIVAGAEAMIALKSDGTVWAWGANWSGQVGDGSTTTRKSPVQLTSLSNVTGIAMRGSHAVALASDGTVKAWGSNSQGQIGDGTTTNRLAPVAVSSLSSVIEVAAGGNHSFAKKDDGTVYAWGANTYGQLGDGTTTQRNTPVAITALTNVMWLTAGGLMSHVTLTTGTARGWGYNGHGQVGDGTTTQRTSPVEIGGVSSIALLESGQSHSVVITTDGQVWTWGYNANGQLGDGSTTSSSVPVQIAEAGYAWKVGMPAFSHATGTYVNAFNVTVSTSTAGATIHYTTNGAEPTTADPVIASGSTLSIAQTTILKARAWKTGFPTSGVASATYTMTVANPGFSPGPSTYTTAQTVTLSTQTAGATIHYTLDGSVPSTASAIYTSALSIANTTTVRAIGVKTNWTSSPVVGGTYTMNFGTLADPSISPAGGTYTSEAVVTISGPAGATIRYTTDGSAVSTTSPVYTGAISLGATSAVRARAYHPNYTTSGVALTSYTIVVATPTLNPTAGTVAATSRILIATTTAGATVRYTLDGSVPTQSSPIVPSDGIFSGNFVVKAGAWKAGATPSGIATAAYEVTGTHTLPKISAGEAHTLAVRHDGVMWAWGVNSSGQLGDGTLVQRYMPALINGVTGVTAPGTGDHHSLAVTADAVLYSWGVNANGRLGNGSTTQRDLPGLLLNFPSVAASAGGTSHSMVLRTNGSVWTFGLNSNGQLGDGTTTERHSPVQVTSLSGVTGIAAGSNSSYAVKADGTVWVWGANANGQLGLGDTVTRLLPAQSTTLSGATAVSSGMAHGLALLADGTLRSWGFNSSGQLGDATTTQKNAPVAVNGLTSVTAIAAGAIHSLALTSNGTVWAWGANGNGQVGDGTGIDRHAPVAISGLPAIAAIAVGRYHSFAIAADGRVWAWGRNTSGQLGDGTTTNRMAPVQIAGEGMNWKIATPVLSVASGLYRTEQAVTVTSPDTAAVLHYTVNGSNPTTSDPIVSSGSAINVLSSLTLKVRAWKPGSVSSEVAMAAYELKVQQPTFSPAAGAYSSAQNVGISTTTSGATITYTVNGTEPTSSSTPYTGPVSIGSTTTMKARAFRSGWTPSDSSPSSYMIAGAAPATPTISPATGSYTAPFLATIASTTADATIRYTLDGTDPDPRSPVYLFPFLVEGSSIVRARAFFTGTAVSAVASATYTLHPSTQSVRPLIAPAGGFFAVQQLVNVTGSAGATLRYTTDGSDPSPTSALVPAGGILIPQSLTLKVRAWSGSLDASEVARVDFVITGAIAAGSQHTLALDHTGKVWAWGRGYEGQLGNGTGQDSIAPVTSLASGAIAIAAGQFHSVAAGMNTVWAWGKNNAGQLGDNTLFTRLQPVAVQFSGGPYEFAAVASGQEHSLALTADGRVFGWGDNQYGQLGGPAAQHKVPVDLGLGGILSVAAGNGFTLAVQRDGSGGGWLWAVGKNDLGQLGDGSVTNRNVPVRVAGIENAVQVVAGHSFGAVLLADGTVKAWGDNAFGQLGTLSGGTSLFPATVPFLSRIVSLSAGSYHVIAVDDAGRAWAWGLDHSGQLGVTNDNSIEGIGAPIQMPVIEGAIAAAAGWQHTIVLRADGSLMAVGTLSATGLAPGTHFTAQQLPLSLAPNTSLTVDTDSDGLPDWLERRVGTNPAVADSNGNGLSDFADFIRRSQSTDPDDDRDGVPNFMEIARGTDPFSADSDGDSVSDLLDAFPLDPERHQPLASDPADTTPPVITLTKPAAARPVGGGGGN